MINKSAIRSIIEYQIKNGYRLLNNSTLDNEHQNQTRENRNNSIAINLLNGLVFGPASWSVPASEEQLIRDLKVLTKYSISVGYKTYLASAHLALTINAEGLTDAHMVGMFKLLRDDLKEFKKYSTGLNSIFGDARGVYCTTYILFNRSEHSKIFMNTLWKECDVGVFSAKGVNISPIVVDFESKWVFELKKLRGFVLFPDLVINI